MKKHIIAVAIVIASLVYSSALIAGPGLGISKTAPISGTGSSGSPLKLDVCSSGSGYVSNGTSYDCALVGDITGVTAGDGLSGDATSGTASLSVNTGAGLSITADTLLLNMTGASCAGGEAVTAISATGTGTCTAISTSVTAGTNIDVSGSTVSVEPSVTLAGEANTDTLDVLNSATAQTSSVRLVDITPSGTYDVSGGDLNEYGVYSASTATYSSCALTEGSCTTQVHKYAFYANPTDGANNGTDVWSFYGANGKFHQGDDAATFGGAVTLGDSALDGTVVNGDAQFNQGVVVVGLTDTADLNVADDATIGATSSDTLTVNATTTHTAPTTVQDFRGTQIDVASVTGALTDWNPTGLSTATTIRAATTGSTDLVSMAGGAADRKIQITNAGNSVIRVFHEYTTGTTAALRFTFNQNYVYIKPAESMLFSYDSTSSRWRQASGQHQVDVFYVVGALTVDGNTSVGGNTTLGDADADVTNLRGLVKDTSAAPTSPTGCGTGATVSGGAKGFQIVIGTGSPTSCAVTVPSWGNAPTCVASTSGARLPSIATTATSVTVSNSSGFTAADVIHVICMGDA